MISIGIVLLACVAILIVPIRGDEPGPWAFRIAVVLGMVAGFIFGRIE